MRPRVADPALALPRLLDVHRSSNFSNYGTQVTELEHRIAEVWKVASDRVVVVANATLGIAGAMHVAQVESWKIPAWTFAATAQAAAAIGARYSFCDVSPENWMASIGLGTAERDGRVLVLPFGLPLDNIPWGPKDSVVVDAAASFGSMYRPLPDLPASTSIVFSFHATKVVGVGEGAVAVFGDATRAQLFRSWTNFGFNGSREAIGPGINAKMGEYNAAFLHSELDGWPLIQEEWMTTRAKVDEISQRLGLNVQPNSFGLLGPYWIAIFRDLDERASAEENLRALGVASRRWWGAGAHTMTAFSDVAADELNVTNDLASRYLGLPFFRGLDSRSLRLVEKGLLASL